jgi:hypothetical protein
VGRRGAHDVQGGFLRAHRQLSHSEYAAAMSFPCRLCLAR